jgi:hypothetical protein
VKHLAKTFDKYRVGQRERGDMVKALGRLKLDIWTVWAPTQTRFAPALVLRTSAKLLKMRTKLPFFGCFRLNYVIQQLWPASSRAKAESEY